jgi:hypothetical protein
MVSMKKVTKTIERHLAQFQNVMDLLKTIKAGDEHLAQLQNEVDLIEEATMAEGKHLAQIQKEVNSMKMVVDRWLLVPTKQMVGDPASMESPVNMRTPRKSYAVASNTAA